MSKPGWTVNGRPVLRCSRRVYQWLYADSRRLTWLPRLLPSAVGHHALRQLLLDGRLLSLKASDATAPWALTFPDEAAVIPDP